MSIDSQEQLTVTDPGFANETQEEFDSRVEDATIAEFLKVKGPALAAFLSKRRIGVAHLGPHAPWTESQVTELATAWLNAAATGTAPENPPSLSPPQERAPAGLEERRASAELHAASDRNPVEDRLEVLRILAGEYITDLGVVDTIYRWVATGHVPPDDEEDESDE
jgi:hypothetical protein